MPDQVRFKFSEGLEEAKIIEFAESIKKIGLQHPITVRETPDSKDLPFQQKHYIIVCGERRWRACSKAGWTEIPAKIQSFSSAIDVSVYQLAENVQRSDLDPFEQARALLKILQPDEMGNTLIMKKDLCARIGMSTSHMSKILAFGSLPEELEMRCRRAELSMDVRFIYDLSNRYKKYPQLVLAWVDDMLQVRDELGRADLSALDAYIEAKTKAPEVQEPDDSGDAEQTAQESELPAVDAPADPEISAETSAGETEQDAPFVSDAEDAGTETDDEPGDFDDAPDEDEQAVSGEADPAAAEQAAEPALSADGGEADPAAGAADEEDEQGSAPEPEVGAAPVSDGEPALTALPLIFQVQYQGQPGSLRLLTDTYGVFTAADGTEQQAAYADLQFQRAVIA